MRQFGNSLVVAVVQKNGINGKFSRFQLCYPFRMAVSLLFFARIQTAWASHDYICFEMGGPLENWVIYLSVHFIYFFYIAKHIAHL